MNKAESLINAATDYIAATLEQPDDKRAWSQLLIYCPDELISAYMSRRSDSRPPMNQRALEASALAMLKWMHGPQAEFEHFAPGIKAGLLKQAQECITAYEAHLKAEGFVVVEAGEVDRLRSALKGLSDMYSHAWDLVDGGLMMHGSSVERFEKAHSTAYALLNPDNPPLTEDEDDAATTGENNPLPDSERP